MVQTLHTSANILHVSIHKNVLKGQGGPIPSLMSGEGGGYLTLDMFKLV